MAKDADLSRFFATMDLFLASMLILVLAGDLLWLYLGWEGVGLCSFLLIGFWYQDPDNARAARKAFIVTRIGDTAFALALVLLFVNLHTLDLGELFSRASAEWQAGDTTATWIGWLLLAGAVAKSAQLPLHTWLPDAMAGPTPVSALLHAATMVTAGVYLLVRLHPLFELAPSALTAAAWIGAVTLLFAALAAVGQRDIKRVLAWSTISQVGYMFLAAGVGGFAVAMFHLATHACFKSLLFLGAGVAIRAFGGEHDLTKMGGLRHRLPVAWVAFLAGAAALAGFPLISAGFYSKEAVLGAAWNAPCGGVLWAIGTAGVLVTALYAFRLVFLAFHGESRGEPQEVPGRLMYASLVVLGVLSVGVGFVETPSFLGGVHVWSDLFDGVLPAVAEGSTAGELWRAAIASALALLGVWIAARLFLARRRPVTDIVGDHVAGAMLTGFGVDRLYEVVWVRPFERLAAALRNDPADLPWRGLGGLARIGYAAVSGLQTGRVRSYAMLLAAGAVLLILAVVL